MAGDTTGQLHELEQAADRALSINALPLAADIQEKLARELAQHGYTHLAITWGERAIENLSKIRTKEMESAAARQFEQREIQLREFMLRLELSLMG